MRVGIFFARGQLGRYHAERRLSEVQSVMQMTRTGQKVLRLNIPSSRSPAFSRFDDAASHWFDLSVMRQDHGHDHHCRGKSAQRPANQPDYNRAPECTTKTINMEAMP